MPYLTTIKRPNEPIVLVNEDLLNVKGLNDVVLSGYTSGTQEQTTDRDAPRTSDGTTSGTTNPLITFTRPDGYAGIGTIPKQGDILPGGSTITLPNGLPVTIPRINGPENPAYVSGYEPPVFGGTDSGGGGSTGTPDKNGFVWTLPNGQGFPPTRILLFSANRKTLYYEDKDLTTKFQVIGKTIEQCSRVSNEQVGQFTGRYQFNNTDSFGKGYTLKSLEVKTKFPFDRLGNPVETEYTLWVDTFVRYFTDNVQSITTNQDGTLTYHYANGSTSVVSQNGTPIPGGGGGYTDGTNTNTGTPAAKSNTGLLLVGGLLLILFSSKSK